MTSKSCARVCSVLVVSEGLTIEKSARFLIAQIAVAQRLLQLAEAGVSRSLALQVVQEFLEGAHKQSNASEVVHVGEDVHRIDSL